MIGQRKNTWKQILFPPSCPGCGEVLYPEEREKGFCKKCRSTVRYIGDNGCIKCGKRLEDTRMELCDDCKHCRHVFLQNRSVYDYEGTMKKAMYRFKYGNCRGDARVYAKDAWEMYGGWIQRMAPDMIVPVPMYRRKERQRGYNQAKVFAEALAGYIGCPVCSDLVVRTRDTTPLKGLDDVQRKKNLENAFKIGGNDVKLRKILLIDDIYTTGSTLDGVASALYSAGAQQVFCLTICGGRGK